jgi:N-acetylglucosamine-6-phosphate deacetylase
MTTATGSTVLRADRIITPAHVHSPGWVAVDQGRIVEVGTGEPAWPVHDLGPVTLTPGFVDLHCHGGQGFSYSEGTDAARQALLAHRRHGTTSMVASLATDTLESLATQLRGLAPLVAGEELVGVHLEGPWLSDIHCGAHDASLLRDPDPAEVTGLLDSAPGVVVMVTLAAERPGGLATVERLAAGGVLAALGHSDAGYEMAQAAIDAGARVATHLFNAERALHHREPGLVLALLERDEVTVELIADGVHLHPAVLRAAAVRKPSRFALVTDAMAAAAIGDGDYLLGTGNVQVRKGVARLARTGVLAGSVLTLDAALRHAVQVAGLDVVDAVAAVTRTPADLLARPDLGRLEPGARADLVALDDGLEVRAVMRNGRWVRLSER